MGTFYAKAADVNRQWVVIDAADKPLGRVATVAATLLKGKHKPIYTPHCDTGDFVIIVNADKIKLTGAKSRNKTYFSHSGYPGGAKETTFERAFAAKGRGPRWVVEHAVKGMLPKNTLGREQGMKLKVYTGADHPHIAQKPVNFEGVI